VEEAAYHVIKVVMVVIVVVAVLTFSDFE